jgi:hypothetical protein
MMISHKLADDYVITDLFSFGYDLLQNFFSICKSFLLVSFMNENKVFPFKKKKKTRQHRLLSKIACSLRFVEFL